MSNISFLANYIKPVYVQKRDENDNLHPYKTSMVEIDKTSHKDRILLDTLSHNWGVCNYISDIYYEMEDSLLSGRILDKKHIFAITSQMSDWSNMRPDDVLAVAQFAEKDDMNELEYIQVNPEHGYVNFNSSFKNIGSAMLKFLADTFPEKRIKVFPAPNAVEFYKKNNYKPYPEEKRALWNA